MLTFNSVFIPEETKVSNKLAEEAYRIYKRTRIKFTKIKPLSEREKYLFDIGVPDFFPIEMSSSIPQGYDYINNEVQSGYINLEYIDFFDYLPKEDFKSFSKRLQRFIMLNKRPRFPMSYTKKDTIATESYEHFFDGVAYRHLCDACFSHNYQLERNTTAVLISICNLSDSFLVVRYRVYCSEEFNKDLNSLYGQQYNSYFRVSRQIDCPWFMPWKFGKYYYHSNTARLNAINKKMAEFKWQIYKEIKKYFTVYFKRNDMFPPTFETYSTNIRSSKDGPIHDFWESIGIHSDNTDYSTDYNMCVVWPRNSHIVNEKEGLNLKAYSGGKYSVNSFLPDIALAEVTSSYGVYMVANTINRIASRDIENLNRKISNAIRFSNSNRLLKLRMKAEKKVYYTYRFIKEFTGKSIDVGDVMKFHCPYYRKIKSISENSLSGITQNISKTKEQINSILQLLNNFTEYSMAKSNMGLQWFMTVITILSLVVAIIALTDYEFDISAFWQWFCKFVGQKIC